MAKVRVEVPVEDSREQKMPANVHEGHGAPKGSAVKKAALIIVGLLLVIFVVNLVNERNKLKEELSSTGTASQKVEDIVAELSKTVELPSGEIPQMRTIEDASKFTQQNPSLADIKNGDQLLFFEKSQKVVVYRPSTKKAVVVVTLSQPTTESNQTSGQ